MSIHIRDPKQTPAGCVIWMHGLGANANDMMGLADELKIIPPVRHVFLDAPVRPVTINNGMPMRAWYDILGVQLSDREDRAGIQQSESLIHDVVEKQIQEGFSSKSIFLAGFSQGGAMALYAGLRTQKPLAGLIALSSYLPLATDEFTPMHLETPIFVASGEYDPIVLPAWTNLSVGYLLDHGYQDIHVRNYAMDHSICMQEINDLSQWMLSVLKGKEQK